MPGAEDVTLVLTRPRSNMARRKILIQTRRMKKNLESWGSYLGRYYGSALPSRATNKKRCGRRVGKLAAYRAPTLPSQAKPCGVSFCPRSSSLPDDLSIIAGVHRRNRLCRRLLDHSYSVCYIGYSPKEPALKKALGLLGLTALLALPMRSQQPPAPGKDSSPHTVQFVTGLGWHGTALGLAGRPRK
jgi:hypothetical protein